MSGKTIQYFQIYKKNLLLALLSLVAAWSVNTANNYFLKKEKPQKISEYNLVKTLDDASYLMPALNFYRTQVWKDNFIGTNAYFLRPPGYGLFIWIHLQIFGEKWGLHFYKFTQLLLYSFAVFLFSQLIFFKEEEVWKTIFKSSLFLLPILYGFTFYSLTESITPSLVMIYIWSVFRLKNKGFLCTHFLLACIILVRPVLGFLILIPIIKILFSNQHNSKIKSILGVFILSFSLFFCWICRNYKITKSFTGLHPIYYFDNNTQYRPVHEALWNWVKCFDCNGEKFHSYTVPFWKKNIQGDSLSFTEDSVLKCLPNAVLSFHGKDKIRDLFALYKKDIWEQKIFYDKKELLENPLPTDRKLIEGFHQLRIEFIEKFPLQYYLITPFQSCKKLIFQSGLNLYFLQFSLRGNLVVEILRICSLLLIVLSFFSSLWGVIFFRNVTLKAVCIVILLYVFYLSFFQRGNEERYLTPLLPLFWLTLNSVFSSKNSILED